MRPLVDERVAKSTRLQHRRDARGDAAGEVDAAARHEHQRRVAGHPAEMLGEYRQRFLRLPVVAGKSVRRDLRRRVVARRRAVAGADRLVEPYHPGAAQHRLGRDARSVPLDVRPHLEIARRHRPKPDVPAFAGDRNPHATAQDQRPGSEPGARPDHDPRAILNRAIADHVDVAGAEFRQTERLRFESLSSTTSAMPNRAISVFGVTISRSW